MKRTDVTHLRNEVLIVLAIVGIALMIIGVNLILSNATARSVPTLTDVATIPTTQWVPGTPGATLQFLDSSHSTHTPQSTIHPTSSLLSQPDIAALQHFMLGLVNDDRRAAGLSLLEWDEFAAQVGQAHAEDMAANGYMSHWNLSGEGPDIRYGRAGGTETVQENVYMYWWRYDDGSAVPITKWEQVVRDAQVSLMGSPGHRANILNPDHTHVGIGITYNTATGDVRIAQEFLNRYVLLEPLPTQAHVGDTLTVRGQLLPGASNPLINLAHEPFPQPMTVSQTEARHVYQSPAELFFAIEPGVDAAGQFSAQLTLDAEGLPRVYHVLIWVDVDKVSVHAVNATIDVE